jgi:hypothetical protein
VIIDDCAWPNRSPAPLTTEIFLGQVAQTGAVTSDNEGSLAVVSLNCGGAFLLVQTPYSELGVAAIQREWQDSHRTWLDWGDRQCVAPLNDLGFPRAGPFFYVYPLFATCGGIQ